MALYKNDVRLRLADLNDKEADHAREILKELWSFATTKGIVRFKTLSGMKNPAIYIPLLTNVRTEKGSYTIRYATNMVMKNNIPTYTPPTIRWPKSRTVDLNQDPELAIFLYGYSTLCLNGANPNKSKTCWFSVEDRAAEARDARTSELTKSNVGKMVLSLETEGGLPMTLLLSYARSLQITITQDDSEEIIRNNIYSFISATNRWQDFLDSYASTTFHKHVALIEEAMRLQVIMQHQVSSGWQWSFAINGKPFDYIVSFNDVRYAINTLIAHITTHQDVLRRLQEVVMQGEVKYKAFVPDPDMGADMGTMGTVRPIPEKKQPVKAIYTAELDKDLSEPVQEQAKADEVKLTPGQKAAITRARNKALKEKRKAAAEARKAKEKVKDDFSKFTGDNL